MLGALAHLVPLITLEYWLRLGEYPGCGALTPLDAVVGGRCLLTINHSWLGRLCLLRCVIVLEQIVHIKLCLGIGKLVTWALDICVDPSCVLILALPTINKFGFISRKNF